MPAVAWTVVIKMDVFQELAEDMRERLKDLTPVTKAAAEDLHIDVMLESFETRTSPADKAWKPLQPETKRRKARQGFGTDPLVRRGDLKNRLAAEGKVDKVVFGISPTTPYGTYQQFGAKPRKAVSSQGKRKRRRARGTRKGIPARPFLPVDKSGVFVSKGRAGAWLKEFGSMVTNYVTTGKVD